MFSHLLQDRQLDGFYSLEEDCLANKADCAAVCRQLQQPVGSAEDKLRLALVWLLTCESGEGLRAARCCRCLGPTCCDWQLAGWRSVSACSSSPAPCAQQL